MKDFQNDRFATRKQEKIIRLENLYFQMRGDLRKGDVSGIEQEQLVKIANELRQLTGRKDGYQIGYLITAHEERQPSGAFPGDEGRQADMGDYITIEQKEGAE